MGLSFQSQQRAVQCGAGGAAVDQLRGHVRVENWAESPTSEKRSGRLCSGGVGRAERQHRHLPGGAGQLPLPF